MTAEDQANNVVKWIEDMRINSRGIRKLIGRLGSFRDGQACLVGYGCEVLGVDHLSGDGVSSKLAALTGMHSGSGHSCRVGALEPTLTEINDKTGRNFREMADYMLENADSYFKPEVAVRVKQYFKNKET